MGLTNKLVHVADKKKQVNQKDGNNNEEALWQIGKIIGTGSFGCVYSGVNCATGEDCAVKTERIDAKHPQLYYEYRMLKHLQKGYGFPKPYFYGTLGAYRVIFMRLLGPSLEDMFNLCGRQFSLACILFLANAILHRIEYLHNLNFIHRDIKPDNFLLGLNNPETIFMIDFGLAKKYRDSKSKAHIPLKENKGLIGTARYASVNSHLGLEQGRRDDLEAIGYVLIYFSRGGSLPWQGFKGHLKHRRITETKLSTTVQALCKGSPSEFATYMNYCKTLKFYETPDYAYLRKLFFDLGQKEKLKFSKLELDWIPILRSFGGSLGFYQNKPGGLLHSGKVSSSVTETDAVLSRSAVKHRHETMNDQMLLSLLVKISASLKTKDAQNSKQLPSLMEQYFYPEESAVSLRPVTSCLKNSYSGRNGDYETSECFRVDDEAYGETSAVAVLGGDDTSDNNNIVEKSPSIGKACKQDENVGCSAKDSNDDVIKSNDSKGTDAGHLACGDGCDNEDIRDSLNSWHLILREVCMSGDTGGFNVDSGRFLSHCDSESDSSRRVVGSSQMSQGSSPFSQNGLPLCGMKCLPQLFQKVQKKKKKENKMGRKINDVDSDGGDEANI